jgi:preprotein translocase subunit SecG
MTFLYYVVISLHLIACFFLIGVVLLQQGKGGDLASAFGGGGTQTAFGPRGSANVLSRGTTVLAAVFMVTSLALSTMRPKAKTLLDEVQAPAAASPASAPVKPAAPPAAPSPVASPATK